MSLWGASMLAAEPEVNLQELVRFPPVAASNAVSTVTLRPGFRLETIAAEPFVQDPIEVCFDENGRMFVVEMIDYSELRDAQPHLGLVRMLEDADGDGRYDRSSVFADDLPWPTGAFWVRGGLLVAATPDIWFFQDLDGDGRAERRTRYWTGFGSDYAPYRTNQLNMQAMLNSFRWGLDNRIHGVTGPNGGTVRSEVRPEDPTLNLRGRDFAIDPRGWQMTAEAGGGQYGLCFDDWGRRFTCNNSDHLRVFLFDASYGDRSALYAPPSPLASIAADGPAAEVYRRSPEEPWRVIRTRWRVGGLVPGPIEGGGRASGYFTSATGVAIYRGDAWPEEYVGDAFTADCGSNLVHRKRLRPDGVGLVGERAADEQRAEFLASTDTWFRPVQLVNAPDGCLWVVDMYREIIEHPWSLPPTLKKHLDLNAGNTLGRIYRIAPEGYRARPIPRLGQLSTRALVGMLEHRNAWHRETAARLLYERQDREHAVPELERLLLGSASARARLHALHALEGQGALRMPALFRALEDPHEQVRAHGVKLCESRLREGGPTAAVLEQRLFSMSGDPSGSVRFQLAFTLGATRGPGRDAALVALARSGASDPWMRVGVLTSASVAPWTVLSSLCAERSFASERGGMELLTELVRMAAAGGRAEGLEAGLRAVEWVKEATPGDEHRELRLVAALAQGLRRAGVPFPADRLGKLLVRVRELATDRGLDETLRLSALPVLGAWGSDEAGALLVGLLGQAESQPIQLGALQALEGVPGGQVARGVVARWATLTPRLRAEAVTWLLARRERWEALFEALEQGTIRTTALSSTQVRSWTEHRDEAVRDRARALFSRATGSREAAVAALQPALEMTGDPNRGRTLFGERCASCHRLGREGFGVGPDLTSVRNSGKEKLLVGLVDPNREVLPQFQAYEVESREGEVWTGLLVAETAHSLTVRQAYGREVVVARSNLERLEGRGLSLMPEELEAGLSAQQVADLLEWVLTAEGR